MCSIAGSSSLEKAHELYKQGLDRGYQSSGFLGVTKNNFVLLKQKEVFELAYLKKQLKETEEFPIYCLFHSRAGFCYRYSQVTIRSDQKFPK